MSVAELFELEEELDLLELELLLLLLLSVFLSSLSRDLYLWINKVNTFYLL